MSEMLFSDYDSQVSFNRYSDLDGIEAKIIDHLVNSKTPYASTLWKLLKYPTIDALAQPDVSVADRKALVFIGNNGSPDASKKRVFMMPFVDDAWQEQCGSIYVYVRDIKAEEHLLGTVTVGIQTVVHSKVGIVASDGDPFINPNANPDESRVDDAGNSRLVVEYKSRETTMLKSLLADLSGINVDGVGVLQLNEVVSGISQVKQQLWNSRSYYGHEIIMATKMGAVADANQRMRGY